MKNMGRNPFDEDEDETETPAAPEKARPPKARRPAEEDLEVDLEDDDDDEPAATAPSRAEKKAARKRLLDEYEEVKQKNAELERRLNETAAYLQQQAQFQRQPAAQQEQPDPFKEEMKRIQLEEQLLLTEYQARPPKNADEQRAYQARAQEVELRKLETVRRHSGGQPAPQRSQQDRAWEMFQMRHPDVAGNRRATEWVVAQMAARVAEHGPGADTWEAADELVGQARVKFMGKPPPRDANIGRKLAGSPRGSSGSAVEAPRKFVMTPEHKALADAMFDHIRDDKRRWTHYARTVGRRLSASGKT